MKRSPWILASAGLGGLIASFPSSAWAMTGALVDKAADILALIVRVLVPVAGIYLLRMIHILSDKIADRRRSLHRAALLAIGLAVGLHYVGIGAAHAQGVTGVEKEGAFPGEAAKDKEETSKEKPFFLWADNSITILPYGWGYEVDPSEQSTLTFEHVHASAIGDLFLFVDATHFHDAGAGDENTWYGEVSPRLSLGKILGKDLSFTLFRRSLFEVKDVLLAAQYERGEDPDVAEAALVGLGLDLDMREAGLLGLLGKFKYIQLNFYARAELTEGVEHGIRDMQITLVAGYPLKVGSARFLVDGYFDWVLGIGSEDWSYHLNPQIKVDLGNFWNQPEKLYAGVELDFWWNKYQIPDTSSFDTNQGAVSLLLKYHF